MFRVKTSPADEHSKTLFLKRLVFLVDGYRRGKSKAFLRQKSEMVKKWKMVKVLVLLVLVFAMLPACRTNTPVDPKPETSGPMRVVTDDLGRSLMIPVKITRAVSLAPNLTENIFAVGAGDRLVGVTTFCNYPEAAKSIAKVGDTMSPNMETIVALKPDVVFVSTASQIETFAKTLSDNGIAVYVTNPNSLADVTKNLKKLGEIFETEEATRRLLKTLLDREMKICGQFVTCSSVDLGGPLVKMVPVFVQISKEPLFTIGSGSFLNDLISEAGGRSVTEQVESAYPKLSKETASALNPDVIILSDSEDNREPNEVFKNSPAVKNGRVYKINADILSRPGPRLVDALEQIARFLHPDKFPE
jgi:iron complex transport system substrate-binding protein